MVVREAEIKGDIDAHHTTEVMFLVVGIAILALAGVVLFCYFERLNLERQTVFEVFLEISEPLIQSFSSKTERFLVSLHS